MAREAQARGLERWTFATSSLPTKSKKETWKSNIAQPMRWSEISTQNPYKSKNFANFETQFSDILWTRNKTDVTEKVSKIGVQESQDLDIKIFWRAKNWTPSWRRTDEEGCLWYTLKHRYGHKTSNGSPKILQWSTPIYLSSLRCYHQDNKSRKT